MPRLWLISAEEYCGYRRFTLGAVYSFEGLVLGKLCGFTSIKVMIERTLTFLYLLSLLSFLVLLIGPNDVLLV